MFGCVLFKKGRASNGNMFVVGPPFVLTYVAPPTAPVRTTLTPCLLGRYEEPLPRADGFFVPGTHKFTASFNVWGVNGIDGDVLGDAGAQNETMRAPIAEHVKNLLRGRERWGVKHRLTPKWSQLSKGKLKLTGRAAVQSKRARKQ